MSRLAIHLLGAPRIEIDGQPVEPDTRKAIALLAYLAVTGQRHTRDTLATLLWPEYDQSRGRAALRRTLSALKSAVHGYGLDIRRDSLSLEPTADIWVDVGQFRGLLVEYHEHDQPLDAATLASLSKAVDLYRDDFMAGFSLRDSAAFDEWQYLEGERLRRDLARALKDMVQCLRIQGQYEAAIEYARRQLELDPLSEQAHRQLMELYTSNGQRAAALRQHRDCVRILEEELGVPPLEETTTLYEQILAGQLSTAIKRRGDAGSILESPSPRVPLSPLPLVGRAAEWASLLEWYGSVDVSGRFVVLEGEAGIGKTHLGQAFLNYAREKGSMTLVTQCYEGESSLAYAPFAEGIAAAIRTSAEHDWLESIPPHWLAEATRLAPDLAQMKPDLPPLPALDSPGAQSRFFESIRQLMVAMSGPLSPAVIFVDDLHWADEASLDLLSYLVRRLHGRSLFILVTWRREQVPPNHRLRQVLASAEREGTGKILTLSQLDEPAVRELVQATAIFTDDEDALVHRLYRETEGHPFFLVEYLTMLDAAGQQDSIEAPSPIESATPAFLPMPGSVRDLLRSRLATVNETGRQLLHTAAVIGRSFNFDILREASGRGEEETVTALEELLVRRLVIERTASGGPVGVASRQGPETAVLPPGGPVYDFSHEKLRTLVYEEMSLARRRLLHRRVAQALVGERHAPPGTGPESVVAAQAAYHYQWAGLEEMAAELYKQAGDQARALYANAEALAHYQAALALGYGNTGALHEAIGDLHTLRGEYDSALSSYEAAAAVIETLAQPGDLARLETKLGGVYHRRGDWELATGTYQQALAHITDAGQRGRLLAEWSLTAHHGGDVEQAPELAKEAMVLARSAGDQQALAQAHNILGILANSRGDVAAASQHLEQSLALADRLGDPGVKMAALNNLSLARRAAGEMDRALELAEQALALGVELGDRHREAALHNNLADLQYATGRSEAAMDNLKQAVTIYAEIGGDKSDWRPEIWKLTEW